MKNYPSKLRKEVVQAIKDARYHLNIEDWDIQINWLDEDKKEDVGKEMSVVATMHVNRRYLTAEMDIYPALLRKFKTDKQGVRDTVFHECSHILTQHLYECAVATYREEGEMTDAWETLTERISRLAKNCAKK